MQFRVEGYPPIKDKHFSIRNIRHPKHSRFQVLRQCAIEAMDGRACYEGPVRLEIILHTPNLEQSAFDAVTGYGGGIMDTLDGSHGYTFTYLPIVYQDDCQVCDMRVSFKESPDTFYEIKVTFLDR